MLVALARSIGVSAALHTPLASGVARSTLASWVKGIGNHGLPDKMNKPADRDRSLLGSENESKLYHEILDRRRRLLFVSVSWVRQFAKSLGPPSFKASYRWFRAFCRRWELALRPPTFRKQQSAASKDDLLTRIRVFLSTVAALRSHHSITLSNIFNFDEMRLASESYMEYCVGKASDERVEVREEVTHVNILTNAGPPHRKLHANTHVLRFWRNASTIHHFQREELSSLENQGGSRSERQLHSVNVEQPPYHEGLSSQNFRSRTEKW